MTLTEFLLARIAEDEAASHTAHRHYQHVEGIPHYFSANQRTSVAMNPRVALAECEAKRRIVGLVDWLDNYGPAVPPILSDRPSRITLRLLALPYADHPDYDEAWRV